MFNPEQRENEKIQIETNTQSKLEAQVEIDPETLEKIQKLIELQKSRPETSRTSFAQSLSQDAIKDYIYSFLEKIKNTNEIKTNLDNLTEDEKQILENHRPGMSQYEGNWDGTHDLLGDALMGIPAKNIFYEYRNSKPSIEISKDGNFSLRKEEIEYKEDERVEAIKKYLKGQSIVDLGSGEDKFHWTASMFGAKDYTGIELPFSQKYYGKETPITDEAREIEKKYLEYQDYVLGSI